MTEEPEREVEEMQERASKLEDEIAEVRKDWERKKADPAIPGAPQDDDSDD